MTQYFDRNRIQMAPLSERRNRCEIPRDMVSPDSIPQKISPATEAVIEKCVARIVAARKQGSSVVMAFGAHAIKNGLALVLQKLLEEGWVTHLATNGAGIIHDWEFAYLGATSEDVADNVRVGRFGNWEETGRWINLALSVGAQAGLGYGESVGSLIANDGLLIPKHEDLLSIASPTSEATMADRAAALDLLSTIESADLPAGWLPCDHERKDYSLQASAYRLGIPFTSHPMFGHDIIYNHPLSCGAAIGRTAERDWLRFVESISHLSGGVYLSVGSALMSPMIFEKALSACRNVSAQEGKTLDDFLIAVVDLAISDWDWGLGEPPESDPAYYQRSLKTFSRMGGSLMTIQEDNRVFLSGLLRTLRSM